MNMNDLKSGEPYFGRWFIRDYMGSTSSGSIYLIYCIEHGVYEYSRMKVIGVPKDKSELKQIQFQGLDYDSTVQYSKELVNDMYREICLVEEMNDKSHLLSYKDHMIFQRENGFGYDVFLRMEYLPHISEELQLTNLSKQAVLRLGKDICDALVVCENYHIVHGNLRPEAIFVTPNGGFKLGDFSFSRFTKEDEVFYDLKDMADYMAPEVYQGKEYDNRADIYSLGLVLYQLLNDNKLPYLTVALQEATSAERQLAMKQRFESAMLPNPVHATEELAKVIAKACDLDPKRRYQRAEEFKDALLAIAVILGSDYLLDKDHISSADVYIKNEIEDTSIKLEAIHGFETQGDVISTQRLESFVKEDNPRSIRPWFLVFLVFAFISTLIVVLIKIDYMKYTPTIIVVPAKETESKSSTKPMEESTTELVEELTIEPAEDWTTKPEEDSTMKPEEDFTTKPLEDSTMKPKEESTIKPEEDSTTKPTGMIDQEEIVIGDSSLITITKSGENLTSLDVVTDLDRAVALDLSNNKLTKIDGLEEAIYAETLVLSYNHIADVEGLHKLRRLKALDISNNQVTSLIKLGNLDQLEILSASNNLITSLDGLENLTALRTLYLDGNSIQDLTILKELTTLEMIDLSNNNINDKDIKALQRALPECIILY